MRRWMALAVVGTMALPCVASADTTAEQKRTQAEALNAEAKALAAKKDFVAAREKFLQAYAVWPAPSMLFNAARTDQIRGEYADAWGLYRTYLALPPSEKVTAKDRKDAEQYAEECGANICRLDVRGAKSFTVDGKVRPEPYVVPAGSREIVMEGLAGTRKTTATCKAGTPLVVEYETPKSDVPPPKPVTPPIAPPPVERTEKGSWLVPGVLAGVGVVGVGIGVGLGLATVSKENALLSSGGAARPCDGGGQGCPTEADALSSARGLRTGFIVAYAIGGAALGGALVTALVLRPWEARPVKERTFGVVPWLGVESSGLAAYGRF